ncbi:DUF4144 family protein [Pseudoalteromonas mariniglutinosa]|uniref:DUF4144 family protein n=1 Tax=Pseudoalteromonas mariniglutinosa TaxID=206042 RepID=UPI00384B918B
MCVLFPYLLSCENELEVINSQQDLDDYLYGLTDNQQQHSVILNRAGQYFDLSYNSTAALSDTELARRVTLYLAKEGHCCLTKITTLTPAQAFTLLAID